MTSFSGNERRPFGVRDVGASLTCYTVIASGFEETYFTSDIAESTVNINASFQEAASSTLRYHGSVPLMQRHSQALGSGLLVRLLWCLQTRKPVIEEPIRFYCALIGPDDIIVSHVDHLAAIS